MEMNTIQCLPKEQCTGCAACVNCCPTDCISMLGDEEGFLYPAIAENKCIQCDKCKSICPVLSPSVKKTEQMSGCYAAWSRDDEIRLQSTSGGVFSHLTQAVLGQGGVVVGARYRADHLVEHVLITNEKDLPLLRQSKYVQSEIGLIYRQISDLLNKKVPVLFAGTPCQCAGLNAFLSKEYDNLYLCDFICRGVNSPKVYLDYLHDLEERYESPVKQVWFKNKTLGWNHFCTKIIFEDRQEYLANRERDPFMLGYIKSGLTCYMRPSCYDCLFKEVSRPTDITLGDFWGVEKQFPGLDTTNGVSLVLVQSEKGQRFLNEVHGLALYPANPLQALSNNPCAVKSAETAVDRKDFFRELALHGFFETIKKMHHEQHLC